MTVGLAWTEVGGELLPIEVSTMRGTGKLTLTGKLGDVMQESGQAAFTYVRSRADEFELPENFYKEVDVHVHVPEGAIQKDVLIGGYRHRHSNCIGPYQKKG